MLLQEATNPAERPRGSRSCPAWPIIDRCQANRSRVVSREKVAFCEWVRPRVSRHAFIEVVPAGERIRVFGVHLSAVIAAWTEQRRVLELRALLRSIEHHRDRLHALVGDFNTIAPGATVKAAQLPLRCVRCCG